MDEISSLFPGELGSETGGGFVDENRINSIIMISKKLVEEKGHNIVPLLSLDGVNPELPPTRPRRPLMVSEEAATDSTSDDEDVVPTPWTARDSPDVISPTAIRPHSSGRPFCFGGALKRSGLLRRKSHTDRPQDRRRKDRAGKPDPRSTCSSPRSTPLLSPSPQQGSLDDGRNRTPLSEWRNLAGCINKLTR